MINYRYAQTYDEVFNAFTLLKNEFFSFNGELDSFSNKIYKNGICIIGEKDGVCAVIAFYANDEISKTAFITSVLVSSSERGQGIGTVLVQNAENYCKKKYYKKMRLEVDSENKAAISLYKKLGYSIYEERGKSLYMEKEL